MEINAIKENFSLAVFKLYVWGTSKQNTKSKHNILCSKISSSTTLYLLVIFTMLVFPAAAFAASGVSGALSGITDILKEIVDVFVYDWGYYLGIIALAIQGIRWKMGHISIMQLGGWALGICLVFFAPNIVDGIKNSAK